MMVLNLLCLFLQEKLSIWWTGCSVWHQNAGFACQTALLLGECQCKSSVAFFNFLLLGSFKKIRLPEKCCAKDKNLEIPLCHYKILWAKVWWRIFLGAVLRMLGEMDLMRSLVVVFIFLLLCLKLSNRKFILVWMLGWGFFVFVYL